VADAAAHVSHDLASGRLQDLLHHPDALPTSPIPTAIGRLDVPGIVGNHIEVKMLASRRVVLATSNGTPVQRSGTPVRPISAFSGAILPTFRVRAKRSFPEIKVYEVVVEALLQALDGLHIFSGIPSGRSALTPPRRM